MRRPDRVFKRIALVSAACLVGFVVFVVVRGPTRPAQVGIVGARVGATLASRSRNRRTAFSLPNIAGGDPVSLSAFQGRPVIVNFFASWCPDCRAELAAVATVARASTGRVAVLGVDSNDTSEAAADRLLSAAHATYPVAVDARRQGGDAVPRPGAAGDLLPQCAPDTWSVRPSAHRRLPRLSAGWPGWRPAGERPARRRRGRAGRRAPSSGPGRPRPPLDRAAALAEGAPGIPAKFVFWVLGAVLVLSLGGLLGEHVFSSAGLNPTPTTTPKAPRARRLRRSPAGSRAGAVPRGAAARPSWGCECSRRHRRPAFTLTDQHGSCQSRCRAPPPNVVVLTFFDAPCNDICPVLADEIEQADTTSDRRPADVEFVTVNTDPVRAGPVGETPALDGTGLGVTAELAHGHGPAGLAQRGVEGLWRVDLGGPRRPGSRRTTT